MKPPWPRIGIIFKMVWMVVLVFLHSIKSRPQVNHSHMLVENLKARHRIHSLQYQGFLDTALSQELKGENNKTLNWLCKLERLRKQVTGAGLWFDVPLKADEKRRHWCMPNRASFMASKKGTHHLLCLASIVATAAANTLSTKAPRGNAYMCEVTHMLQPWTYRGFHMHGWSAHTHTVHETRYTDYKPQTTTIFLVKST